MTVKRIDISSISAALSSGSLILTPNNRISSAVLDQFAAQQQKPVWRTPQVKPIDIWIKSLWLELSNAGIEPCCSTAILNSSEEFLLWSDIVEQSLERYPLLNPYETASQLSRAYQDLSQYAEDYEQTELRQYQNIDDVSVYTAWQKQFRTTCSEKGLTPLSDAIRVIIELIPSIESLKQIDIILLNFFQPPLLYQQLFNKLEEHCICNSTQLLSNHAHSNLKRRIYTSANTELRECAQWALDIFEKDKNAHIGIISNGDNQQHSKLESYLDTDSKAILRNFGLVPGRVNKTSNNKSVFDSGIIQTAFQILMLNEEKLDSAEICRLLQSPYFHNSQDNSQDSSQNSEQETFEHNAFAEMAPKIELELFMRNYLSSSFTLSKLIELINREGKPYHCPALASALINSKSLLRKSAKILNSRQWSALFSEQLETLGWPGKSLASKDRDAVVEWNKLLEEFSCASQILGNISFSAALRKLRILSQRSGKISAFLKDCQISLLSPVESIGLEFDYLWLLNFNDQNWPNEAKPSPFLPNALQRELCIPGASSTVQRENAHMQFDILCRSVGEEGVASFHESEDDQLFRPSHFILQFPLQEIEASSSGILSHDAKQQIPLTAIEENNRLPLRENEQTRGGHSIISDQSNCPFKAFANHRLNSSVLEGFEHGLSARARGTAIHIALEQLYTQISSSQQIDSLDDEQRKRLVKESAEQAVSFLENSYPEIVTPRYGEIELQRISNLLEEFLAEELVRPPFTSIAWEQKQSWQLAEDIEDDALQPFQLNLKIDRIDKLEDGSLALIDYKTGKRSYSNKDWLQSRPTDMQLQVYYVASHQDFLNKFPEHKDISALAIAHINSEKKGYSGISQNDSFFPQARGRNPSANKESEWAELTEHWSSRVTELARDFSQGDSRVDPVKPSVSCTYCGLKPLCRIRELNRESLLEDENENIGTAEFQQ